jgi:hypothetical protein
MPTLQSILAEVQAVDTTQLEGVQAALTQIAADLNTLISAPATPAADPIATVVVTTASGVVTTCVPQS